MIVNENIDPDAAIRADKLFGRGMEINLADLSMGPFYFVDGNVAGARDEPGFGNNHDRGPFKTIGFAVTQAAADGVIVVLPGHTETVSKADGWNYANAGVSVVGLGAGSRRPKVTFDTSTAADINIDKASTLIKNLQFVNNIDALVAPIDVDAADFTCLGCDFRDDTAAKQTVRWILGDANADNMRILGCLNRGSDTAGSTAFITLNGADGVVVANCRSNGDFSAANIEVVTGAVTDALITANHLENANAVNVNIEGFAGSTGWLSFNSCRNATDAATTWINTPGNMQLFQNFGVNNNGETGKLIGTASI